MARVLPNIQLRVNQKGGLYDNGRRHSQLFRERVLDLNNDGFSKTFIANELNASRHFVSNVLRDYDITNSSIPKSKVVPRRPKMIDAVVEYVEMEKLCKPSAYCSEIKQRLLLDGVVHPDNLPSVSSIKKCIQKDLFMTKKKIQQVPLESQTTANIEYANLFLGRVSELHPATIHFFDESSVVKTTMNRRYGNSRIGEPAFEMQRYASNATYAINLLHSIQGVDYVEVINGASNGNELLIYFEEVLNTTRADGSVILERGDTVVLDNCGFHHGNFAEPMLRNMFAECGIQLLFQPPYSPHLNTCEFCFRQIKALLSLSDTCERRFTCLYGG